ncbi:MAG TPA: hypothetical protein VE991_09445 [Acidimicrobiales bacterium]|nr:hypothetical protein [Acidimicrobiales bacterium]
MRVTGRVGSKAAKVALLLGLLIGVVTVTGDGAAGAAGAPRTTGTTGIYAPLDQPGPPLSVPAPLLAASLQCAGPLAGVGHDPVLLVPGTALDPQDNYSWNYERGLTALGLPWCALTLPDHGMDDVGSAGEYVVSAIRSMAAASGRQVDILGYSQGGMVPRWALRFWPDTRPLVRELVAIDPSNHGTLDASGLCRLRCPPSFWQQAAGSHFLQALNSGAETFAGIDYVVLYSRTDEVVFPNLSPAGSSALHTGAGAIENLAVQQRCPADPSEHLLMGTVDPVAYALATDALVHEDLPSLRAVPGSTCLRLLAPDVVPSQFPARFVTMMAGIGAAIAGAPEVASEPALPSYVYAH